MNLDKEIAQLAKDLDWFSFYARYCAGKNIEKPFCRDFEWWAIGAAVLLAVLVAWWVLGRIGKAWRNWRRRRSLAKVADPETMKKHMWSGHDSPDEIDRSRRKRK